MVRGGQEGGRAHPTAALLLSGTRHLGRVHWALHCSLNSSACGDDALQCPLQRATHHCALPAAAEFYGEAREANPIDPDYQACFVYLNVRVRGWAAGWLGAHIACMDACCDGLPRPIRLARRLDVDRIGHRVQTRASSHPHTCMRTHPINPTAFLAPMQLGLRHGVLAGLMASLEPADADSLPDPAYALRVGVATTHLRSAIAN